MKVLCFTWRAIMGRIPTAEALCHRGISVPSSVCSFSRFDIESAGHVLVTCPLAKAVWEWVCNWCGGNSAVFATVGELIDHAKMWGRCPKKRKVFMVICYGALWSLWLARNERVFNRRLSSASRIMDDVISLVFMWFKHRVKIGNLNWVVWCNSPFDCL